MASRGVNKVILIGNLGQDPDIRYTPNGSAIANLSLATSDSWKDKNTGQEQERVEWNRVVVYGKLAEIAQQILQKGAKVYVEGKLRTRKWQGQDGHDRYTTEVVLENYAGQLQLLDSRQDNNQQQPPPQAQQRSPDHPAQQRPQPRQQNHQQNHQQTHHQQPVPGGFDDFDDDIPF